MMPKHIYDCPIIPTNMNNKIDVNVLTAWAEKLIRGNVTDHPRRQRTGPVMSDQPLAGGGGEDSP